MLRAMRYGAIEASLPHTPDMSPDADHGEVGGLFIVDSFRVREWRFTLSPSPRPPRPAR